MHGGPTRWLKLSMDHLLGKALGGGGVCWLTSSHRDGCCLPCEFCLQFWLNNPWHPVSACLWDEWLSQFHDTPKRYLVHWIASTAHSHSLIHYRAQIKWTWWNSSESNVWEAREFCAQSIWRMSLKVCVFTLRKFNIWYFSIQPSSFTSTEMYQFNSPCFDKLIFILWGNILHCSMMVMNSDLACVHTSGRACRFRYRHQKWWRQNSQSIATCWICLEQSSKTCQKKTRKPLKIFSPIGAIMCTSVGFNMLLKRCPDPRERSFKEKKKRKKKACSY